MTVIHRPLGFLGEPVGQPGRPATLVTYDNDPREDLAALSSPSTIRHYSAT
jgi:hypothetical protein